MKHGIINMRTADAAAVIFSKTPKPMVGADKNTMNFTPIHSHVIERMKLS